MLPARGAATSTPMTSKKPIRWWPAATIVVLAFLGVAWMQLTGVSGEQSHVLVVVRQTRPTEGDDVLERLAEDLDVGCLRFLQSEQENGR